MTKLTEDDVKVTFHRDGTFSVRMPIGQLSATDHAWYSLYCHWASKADQTSGDALDREIRDDAFTVHSAIYAAKRRHDR